jgi:hypothetical protein
MPVWSIPMQAIARFKRSLWLLFWEDEKDFFVSQKNRTEQKIMLILQVDLRTLGPEPGLRYMVSYARI